MKTEAMIQAQVSLHAEEVGTYIQLQKREILRHNSHLVLETHFIYLQ